MGGFALRTPQHLSESEAFLPPGIGDTWFLCEDGIQSMLQRETGRVELGRITKEEIVSKSKANGLAKTLVCLQALWFITQSITRCMCTQRPHRPLQK